MFVTHSGAVDAPAVPEPPVTGRAPPSAEAPPVLFTEPPLAGAEPPNALASAVDDELVPPVAATPPIACAPPAAALPPINAVAVPVAPPLCGWVPPTPEKGMLDEPPTALTPPN